MKLSMILTCQRRDTPVIRTAALLDPSYHCCRRRCYSVCLRRQQQQQQQHQQQQRQQRQQQQQQAQKHFSKNGRYQPSHRVVFEINCSEPRRAQQLRPCERLVRIIRNFRGSSRFDREVPVRDCQLGVDTLQAELKLSLIHI